MSITIQSKQEMIDVINREFKGKAIMDYGCAYLNNKGQRCAIGCFVPFDEMDETDLNELMRLDGDAEDFVSSHFGHYVPSNNTNFLLEFQHAHDHMPNKKTPDEQKQILIKWLEDNYDIYDHTTRGDSDE